MKKNNLSSRIYHQESKMFNRKSRIYHLGSEHGFTLMELLIVVALIALIATAVLVLLNPWAQIAKGQDSKRKQELTQLNKVLEDWYNDKGCYPKPTDICYDPPTNVCTPPGVNGPLKSQKCHICGNESSSPPFSPYLSRLPCDPRHKQKQYLYEVAPASSLNCPQTIAAATNPCPQWYRVYSNLSNQSDPSIEGVGCQASGCGIAPNYGYDFGVTSPNEKLSKTSVYYYYTSQFTCDQCQSGYEDCKLSGCNVYPSQGDCNLNHPLLPGC